MFKEERNDFMFDWSMLGDLDKGRPNLGPMTSVLAYRLLQFSLRDLLIREFGAERTREMFIRTGEIAGRQFYRNVLTKKDNFDEFMADLKRTLKDLNMGILEVESADLETLTFTLTLSEDLDCSGLPNYNEEICTYDEGFLHGILSEHTGKLFIVTEVDCWCSGDKLCRFTVKPA